MFKIRFLFPLLMTFGLLTGCATDPDLTEEEIAAEEIAADESEVTSSRCGTGTCNLSRGERCCKGRCVKRPPPINHPQSGGTCGHRADPGGIAE